MKKYLPLLFLTIVIGVIVFFSINNSTAINVPIADDITNKVPIKFPIKIENNGMLNMIDGKGEYIVSKQSKEKQLFNFRNDKAKTVSIEIITENDTSNIRINRIIFPNGNSDGPFGKNLTYNLKGKGLYQIEIGESLMQGEPFKGNYTLKLQLK